jgi:hypothetical protein
MIQTWEEMEMSGEWDDYGSMAREFAKLHVEAQAEAILEKSKDWKDASNGYSYQPIDKDSILNAYSLENIK